MTVEWRFAYSSAIHKVAPALLVPVLHRVSDLDDYRTLIRVYQSMVQQRVRHLAVLLEGPLPERMLQLCAAKALAMAHSLRLVIIW